MEIEKCLIGMTQLQPIDFSLEFDFPAVKNAHETTELYMTERFNYITEK